MSPSLRTQIQFSFITIQSFFLHYHTNSTFNLFVCALPPPLLDRPHQFVHLPYLLIAQLVQKGRVELLLLPPIPFQLLPVLLPLRQEADNVQRVLDVLVPPELGFEVRVAKETSFGIEFLAVYAQQAAVQWQRRVGGVWRLFYAGIVGCSGVRLGWSD